MKVSAWFLLLAFLVGIAATFIYFRFLYVPSDTFSIYTRRNNDVITLALPNDRDPSPTIFGPKYWEAYHKLTERIPCQGCRSKAVPFMKFFHDVVNYQKGKPIFYKENFNKHLDLIAKIPQQ